ncbi:Cupin domain-containing protein [Flavobacterium sp. CF108]|uniref:cupin domain-containing protein n=1 Tax=unclassified Flavobacterium TaxID=196869 RepID=UPI0008BB7D46|nr:MULTISPECIES: cupin domain-containing protein [unclassified Flavobacterium]SEO18799.1 Cupin domain-containing protein [Flavobacterium sp. fv08]SHG54392.1 Cupin domain-containing protein [Flavobacterium sp. CF108]
MDTTIKIISKNEGERLAVAGGNYRIIISGEQTNGNYAVIEMTVPPGGGPPPHAHPETQEMFHVLEGELEFKTETGKQIVTKDGFINIPFGGAVHCFKNTSENYARLLCTVVPAGLENLFQEIGTPVKADEFLPVPELTEKRREFLKEVDIKYGQRTYPPDYLG